MHSRRRTSRSTPTGSDLGRPSHTGPPGVHGKIAAPTDLMYRYAVVRERSIAPLGIDFTGMSEPNRPDRSPDPSWRLLRGILFELDPERAHDMALGALEWPGVARWLGRRVPAVPAITCMGLTFANRVGLAAGLDKNGDHIDALAALGFGHVEIGTVTPRPQPGNPPPRLFRLERHGALINRLGFNNKGVDHLVRQAERRHSPVVLGINLGKNLDTPNERAAEDYLTGLDRVWPVADYVTINISSPNTQGLRDLQHGRALRTLLDAIGDRGAALHARHGRRVPIALKVAPDLDDAELADVMEALSDRPFAALIVGNTTREREAVAGHLYAGEAGGLSGAPLRAPADDRLAASRTHLERRAGPDRATPDGATPPPLTLIGVGGIDSGPAAARKCRLGAELVQLYTGFIYHGPALVRDTIEACA